MLNYQIDILDKKLPFFLANLILDSTFLAHVRAEKLLGEESIQDVDSQQMDRRRIIKFIEYLKKQAPKKFNVFLKILKETDQDHVHKEINQARHLKIKHLPKSPEVEKNAQEKLRNEFVSYRLLTTSDREYLIKHFVHRADYEEINEDKHILRGENAQLQTELVDIKEQVDYEMKHHNLVKEEYNKVKDDLIKVKHEYKKQVQKITELKSKIEKQYSREKEYKNKVTDLQNEIEQLKQELEEIQRENSNLQHAKLLKRLSSKKLDPIMATEEPTMNADTIHFIQNQLETLQNNTEKYRDEVNSSIPDLFDQLENMKNTVTNIMSDLAPENIQTVSMNTVDTDIAMEKASVIDNTEVEDNNDTVHKNPKHKHIPHKPKHPKHTGHYKERKRVVILETELSDLKNRLKKIEKEKVEQNLILQQREKQLQHEQKQVTSLRMMLRSLRSSSTHSSIGEDTVENKIQPSSSLFEKTKPAFTRSTEITPVSHISLSLRRQPSCDSMPQTHIQNVGPQLPRAQNPMKKRVLSIDYDRNILKTPIQRPNTHPKMNKRLSPFTQDT